MSAPGNTAILLVLLTGFVGCVGYAVGRWHERRQSAPEREEAYRDGYDQAARSVFSMAARLAGPRRRGAVRASAVVSRAVDPPGAPVGEPEMKRSPAGDRPVPGVSVVGFPAPAPQVVPGIPVPPAVGGVHYSSLPDPSWSAVSPEPSTVLREPSAVPRESDVPQARHYAASSEGGPSPRGAGRHSVADELVRAATYKLAADRVARAKVQESSADPAPETGGRPPVPRPRGL
jgi:hypothetical protein